MMNEVLENFKKQNINSNFVTEKKEMVNHPDHYNFGKYEVIDVLQDWFPHEPLKWQIVKYISRSSHKGKEIEDLKKAQFYLATLIAEKEEMKQK